MSHPFACHCHRTPCRCSKSYPVSEPNIVIVSPGSQVVSSPVLNCRESQGPSGGESGGDVQYPSLLKLAADVVTPAKGSQFNFSVVGASGFVRPGDIIQFIGWGQVEVVSAVGDTVLARSLSLPPEIRLAAGQELRVGNPVDPEQIGRFLGTDVASGGEAGSFLGIVDGAPQATRRFNDAAIPIATDQEMAAGFTPLARLNGDGGLRRIPPSNGKVLIAKNGAWTYGEMASQMQLRSPWHLIINTGLPYTPNHVLGQFNPTALPGYSADFSIMWLTAAVVVGMNPGYVRYLARINTQPVVGVTVNAGGASDTDTDRQIFPWPVSSGNITVYGGFEQVVGGTLGENNFTLALVGWQR